MALVINAEKLHAELKAAGISVSGCDSSGRVLDLDGKEIQSSLAVKAVIARHDPMVIKGPTIEQLVHALWLKLLRDDPKEADALNNLYPER
jgi:hypothetical protein